jgi:succinate dehydrogenase/fumarate reductase-like Fe-S protein
MIMSVKLDTRTFFFNAKTDFLAYYKNHTIKMDEGKKVKDLLLEVQALEPIFQFKKTATLLQINGIFVKGSLSIKKAVELFGTSWTIEPISTFRAVKDLIINDEDFIQKHEILGEFADEDDFKYYKSLIVDYYSSDSLNYNQDYFGDSMFVYAHYFFEIYHYNNELI